MFILLNRANLIVAAVKVVMYIKTAPSGRPMACSKEEAEGVYLPDTDTIYTLAGAGARSWDGYRVEEVAQLPADFAPGFFYLAGSGEVFTTPEKAAERAKEEAVAAAPNVAAITFVTLAQAGQIDDVTITENYRQFAEWAYPLDFKAGEIRRYEGVLYRCISTHTSQSDWTPDVAPSLWVKIADPAEEFPTWAQPVGAHDAYNTGDKVTHNGKRWISTVDNNAWEPGVYGWEVVE